LIEGNSLFQRTGETIEDETVFAILFFDTVTDDPNNDIITYQSTRFHNSLGFFTDFGTGGDSRSKLVVLFIKIVTVSQK
jgi:hypothetical protein